MSSFPSPLGPLRLLPDEPDAVQHRLRARGGRLEPAAQHGVVVLEPSQLVAELALLAGTGLRPFELELAHACLGDEGATTEAGELVTQMPHELLELTERKCFRTFAV